MYNNRLRLGPLRKNKRLRFSQILEMNITFMTRLDLMTYEHYLQQPRYMLEKLLNKKLHKNPELVEMTKDLYRTIYLCRKQKPSMKYTNIKIYNNLSNIIIFYYLNHRVAMYHRLIFKRISQNKNM